jgi:hypothetical protein
MPLPPHFGQVLEVCPLPLTSPEITAIGVSMWCNMVPVPLHLRHFPEPRQPQHGVVSFSLIDLSPPIEGWVNWLPLIVRPLNLPSRYFFCPEASSDDNYSSLLNQFIVRKQWGFLIRSGLRGLRPALKLQEHATESCKQRMVSPIGPMNNDVNSSMIPTECRVPFSPATDQKYVKSSCCETLDL